jgi:hypothetical protein
MMTDKLTWTKINEHLDFFTYIVLPYVNQVNTVFKIHIVLSRITTVIPHQATTKPGAANKTSFGSHT